MSTIVSDRQIARIACVESFDALDDLRPAWNRLAGDVPFRRWEWCRAWWRHYATPGARLLVLLVWDAGGALIGVAPWYLESSLQQGRVIRFLGSGEVCSDYGSILAVPGLERIVAQRIATWLHQDAASTWDLIQLDGVSQDDETCHWLVQAMQARMHEVARRHVANAWRVSLPVNWDTFVAGLSKPRRRKIRHLEKDVIGAGRAQCRSVERQAELEQGLHILRDLHQRRRTSLGEVGCFASARFSAFHAEVAREFLRQGMLRLNWVELDGRPVAVEYGFVGGETAYAYQSGFDPDVAHEHPGWLQLIASLRGAIERKYRWFDFLRGDEPYKASWQAEPQPLVEIRIVGRQSVAHLRHAAWRSARAARRLAGRLLGALRARAFTEPHTA